MVDVEVVVDVLVAGGEVQSVERALGPGSSDGDAEIVAAQRGSMGDCHRRESGIFVLKNTADAYVIRFAALQKEPVVFHISAFAHRGFHDGVGQVAHIRADEGLDDGGARIRSN